MRWGNVPPSGRSECGLACLYLILRRHGIDKPLRELRKEYPISRDGMSSRTLRHALLDFGIRTTQKHGTVEDCRHDLRAPKTSIIGYLDDDHFVILDRLSADGSAVIIDPSEGIVYLDSEELQHRWSGVWWMLDDVGIKMLFARTRNSIRHIEESPTLLIARNCLFTNRALISGLFFASMVVLLLSAVVPVITRELINNLNGSPGNWDSRDLATAFVVGTTFYGFVFFVRSIIEAKLHQRVSQVLKSDGFSRLLTATYTSVQKTSPGELIYSLNAAVLVSTGLASQATTIFFNGLLICVLLISVSFVWPSAALVMLIAIIVFFPLYSFISRCIAKESAQEVSADSKGTSEQLQAILSFAVLKMAAAEPYVLRRWQRFNQRGLHYAYRTQWWQGVLGTVSSILTMISPIIPLVWAVISPNPVDLGSAVAAGGVGSIIVSSITQIFLASAGLAQLLPSVERLDEIMWMPQDKRGSVRFPKNIHRVTIEIDNVSIGYDNQQTPVLGEVSFRVPNGSVTVLQGPSGAGKSTLIRCMAGLMDPLSGEVRINDVVIQELSAETRAQLVGFVPQETYLFSGTLRESILVGREYEDADIWEVLDLVCLSNEVRKMPLQLSTPVGEMGLTLSGGQRQRVALARAIIGKPNILLLDEATSAVDVLTEHAIINNLIRHGFTIIAAAHRPAMIDESDIIITIGKNRANVENRQALEND